MLAKATYNLYSVVVSQRRSFQNNKTKLGVNFRKNVEIVNNKKLDSFSLKKL